MVVYNPAMDAIVVSSGPSPYREHWTLDPEVHFLNHGSYGACPRVVLEAQHALRERIERQPVRFFLHHLEPMLDQAREQLGRLVGARADDLAFVTNATSGVNTVLRSLDFGPEDELLVTDHEYNACRNALNFVAERTGARVRVVELPFPVVDPGELISRILDAVGPHTRLLLIDHVTSPTGLVMPLEELVPQLRARGVECLVDGAHAVGMLPLELGKLGVAWYTSNAHKWLCCPKGSAFLYVREDMQVRTHPLGISHGRNATREDRSRFRLMFDWTGTCDPTPWLAIPDAIGFFAGLPGGLAAVAAHNRKLCQIGQGILCEALGVERPVPAGLLGSLASVIVPVDATGQKPKAPAMLDPLQVALAERHFEVPVFPWPGPHQRLLRISAQLYNCVEDYQALAAALSECLELR